MLENALLWAGLLLVLGLVLILLELFVPSGGVLGVLAGVAVVASMFVAIKYSESSTAGATFVVVELVGVAVAIALALKWWPHTSIGRRIAPELPRPEDVLPDDELKPLLGKTGYAKCPMLPSGAVQIEGRTVNAVSEGVAIDAGQLVKVIEVQGSRVVVRPIDGRQTAQDIKRPVDDPLSRPIEELGIEPLDDWKQA